MIINAPKQLAQLVVVVLAYYGQEVYSFTDARLVQVILSILS